MRTDPAVDPATAWAEDVEAGRVLAGPHIRAAARRHLVDLADGGKRGLHWDRAAAQRALDFFPKVLRLNGGQFDGRAFTLDPSQVFRVGSLFGWRNADGLRRFRRFYDEEGKGNGKSPLLAGIGLYGLCVDPEPAAEVYAGASSRDQAMVLFRDAVAMVNQSPALARKVKTLGVDPVWELIYRGKRGDRRFFKPISADRRKSGPRPHFALLDEVHEHRDRSMVDMMEAGFKFRREPLLAMATNAGNDVGSICHEEHTHAINVATEGAAGNVVDDRTFAFVCSLDEDDEWESDPVCWGKANPLLGVTITREWLAGQVNLARMMPGKRNDVARLHFCEWTYAMKAAISREAWMRCVGDVDPDALTEAGYPCFGGLDLSRVRDFTAFTLVWVLDQTPDHYRFASATWFWTPRDTLAERSKTDGPPYEAWVREGAIEAVAGNRISYRWAAEALAELNARYHPQEIGCDQYGLDNLRDHLADIGADLPMTIHPQGFQKHVLHKSDPQSSDDAGEIYLWMPDSINKFEAAIYDQRITVQKNPMMNHCAASTVYAENRTGHRMFDKAKAVGRIDGMVSAAMAIGIASCRDEVQQPSVYEERGVLVL
ncbi:terminase large subunit [Acuticoccus sp. M5D2P5]|uniref:terminase large subunit n=1 Tax=Acuticoccus kalidii TaxID=2910977 RepID=UPI001F4286A7|nr:terminase large subunit [Acuticoccus kalidii]MCF3933291.1 terminase large subunit [Acuticoccus kalidii]